MRVTVIFDNLGPYHLSRLRASNAVCDLTVVQLLEISSDYDWKSENHAEDFPIISLFRTKPDDDISARAMGQRLNAVMDDIHPEVVFIPGWSSRVAFAAMNWCSAHRVPMVVMSDTTAWDEVRVWWKERIKQSIVKLFSAALVAGQPHAEYIARLGMSPDRIFCGYDTVDNAYFQARTDEVRQHAPAVRIEKGLPENYFLASARFVEKKNLSRLIEAYERYRALQAEKKLEAWSLVLLGDGPLRASLGEQIDRLSLKEHVMLPDFVQYADLPPYYALAGAFLHCSLTEQWGLVINEAMAAGLPVIISNRCGCALDLVQDGQNGFTFDPYDVESLARLMLKVSAPDFPPSTFGAKSREIIALWGPDRFADGLRKAVEQARIVPAPRPNVLSRSLLFLLSRARYSMENSVRPAPLESLPSNQQAVQEFFTQNVKDYSALFAQKRSGHNFSFRTRLQLAAQMTSEMTGRLLDCACGSGEITAELLRSGRFTSGTMVDLSPAMLETARQRMKNEGANTGQFEFISSDIFEYASAFQGEPYDLIVCLGLIAHTGRLDELLARLRSLLSADGAILLQSSLLDSWRTKVVRMATRERYYRQHGYRISYYTPQDILSAVAKADLRVVQQQRSTFGFPFGDRISARLNYQLEMALQNWAKRNGTEAMYHLKCGTREP